MTLPSMDSFQQYSEYYDLLNRDKLYEQEAAWVAERIRSYLPQASSLLDVGSGTGIYTEQFQKLGFEAQGIDLSENMVSIARSRMPSLAFDVGDARHFDLQEPVDVITLMFHVMSYLVKDADIREALHACSKNLNENGLLCFDVWHAPAVLTQKPEERTKTYRNGNLEIVRNAHPTHDEKAHTVDVCYHIEVTDCDTTTAFIEHHLMRYFFPHEIEEFLKEAGFELLEATQIATGSVPSQDTWGVFYVARKTTEGHQ